MIISFDTEKAFDRIQHTFMIQTLRKLEIKGNFFNVTENLQKPTASKIFNGERVKAFPPKIGNKTRTSAFITVILHCTRSSSQSNWARKRNKMIPNWKRSKTICNHR